MIFLCRGRLLTPCAHFIQFYARRCSETYILKFWMARRCSETHILILPDEPSRRNRWVDRAKLWRNVILSFWNRSAHWPGRVNVRVLYLQDGSAHCICYHNLLNTVVLEICLADRALALEAGGPGLDSRLRRGVLCSTV